MTTAVSMPATVLENLLFCDDIADGEYQGFDIHPATVLSNQRRLEDFVKAGKDNSITVMNTARAKKVTKDSALTILKRRKELDNAIAEHLADPARPPILIVNKSKRDRIEEQIFERLALDPDFLLCPPVGMKERQQSLVWLGLQLFRVPVPNGEMATFRVEPKGEGEPLYSNRIAKG
ncbi:uncharacterized protein EHS24_000034 [Apiotrichum porosum]|uniref:Uncharacterized protein n=1 Tax=Apiotrichum porosum TaxID=105984 RepID=A0A427Y8T0_9TREE|nr:uncharacterized protein EHS24_000034 [Apiotrichum porosum]RSH87526.1 hypothetical protein EHS24_000034 [Apiotrichum porosum]